MQKPLAAFLLLPALLAAPLRAMNVMPIPEFTPGTLIEWHIAQHTLVAAFSDTTVALYSLDTAAAVAHFPIAPSDPNRPPKPVSPPMASSSSSCRPSPRLAKSPIPTAPLTLPF